MKIEINAPWWQWLSLMVALVILNIPMSVAYRVFSVMERYWTLSKTWELRFLVIVTGFFTIVEFLIVYAIIYTVHQLIF